MMTLLRKVCIVQKIYKGKPKHALLRITCPYNTWRVEAVSDIAETQAYNHFIKRYRQGHYDDIKINATKDDYKIIVEEAAAIELTNRLLKKDGKLE